jgi:hypothetical protein
MFRNCKTSSAYKRRYLFSAKGAESSQPGASPQGIESHIKQAAKSAIQSYLRPDLAVNRAFSTGAFYISTPQGLPQALNERCAVGTLKDLRAVMR